MTNFSETSVSPEEDGPEYNNTWTSSSSNDGLDSNLEIFAVLLTFSPCFFIIGLVGNGIVICLLGFHVKRSSFTTYILNLAVADFGVLLFFGLMLILFLTDEGFLSAIAFMAATFLHSTSQFLLTAISTDRCVSVLFPIWHRCHRPLHLSAIVCALMWVVSCLPSGSLVFFYHFEHLWDQVLVYPFLSSAALCFPLVTISTLILLFKVFCKPQQPRRGRLVTIILLTLLFFLIFAFPLNAFLTLNYFTSFEYLYLIFYGFFCAILNSCVNPVIYYVVGRKKRGQQRQGLKAILQRAFEEKEECREERGITAQTSL